MDIVTDRAGGHIGPAPSRDVELGGPGAARKARGPAEPRDLVQYAQRERDEAGDLPITGSSGSGWWTSIVHNVTAMVGAGVLGLPYAMAFLTWPGGIVMLVLSWAVSLYTLHQLADLHEYVSPKGHEHRFCRYTDLGRYVYDRFGYFLVLIPQLIVYVGLGITYTVTGGQSLRRFWAIVCLKNAAGTCAVEAGLTVWILVFMTICLWLIQVRNFDQLKFVSIAAAVMSLGYSTIAMGLAIHAGKQPGVEYNVDGYSTSAGVLEIFNSLGIVAFAYGGHNVVLEIQACLRRPAARNGGSPPKTYSKYMLGVYIAYAVVAFCYFGVSIAGYHSFGSGVKDNVLASIPGPKWAIAMADLFVTIHVIGSYQLFTQPVMDMIESKAKDLGITSASSTRGRLVYRSVYVVLIAFIAILVPFFGSLMGFIGALGTGPTTFWLPPLFWLSLKKPPMSSPHFWASIFCFAFGIMLTFTGATGGLRDIIVNASTYKTFQ